MVATKRASFAEWHNSPSVATGCPATPPQAGVGKQVADAAFDVNPGVNLRGPSGPTHRIELIFHAVQVKGKSFQHASAFWNVMLRRARPDLHVQTCMPLKVNAVGGRTPTTSPVTA